MEILDLDVNLRDASLKASGVRKQGLVPAVCYGKGFESKPVQVEYQAFRRLYREVGNTQVFNLVVEGEKIPVLVQEIKYHPLTDKFDHIDFIKVNMKVMVTATVPVEITGEAPAVKNFNAVITTAKQEVEVKCLPMDIPRAIEVDVSHMENIGDIVSVSELKIDKDVEILDDSEDTVISITAVEEYKEIEAEVPDDVKEEGEEGEEGDEAKEDDGEKGEEGEKKEESSEGEKKDE